MPAVWGKTNGTGDIAHFNAGSEIRMVVANNGDVYADGTFQGGGADVAEAFEVEGAVTAYEPGEVLVIPTKVTLEGGAIERGDLLVTSSTPGHAMKADLGAIGFGQVIGKALQPYDGTAASFPASWTASPSCGRHDNWRHVYRREAAPASGSHGLHPRRRIIAQAQSGFHYELPPISVPGSMLVQHGGESGGGCV